MNDQTNLPAHVADDSPPAIKNAGMKQGGAIAGLVPQNLDDAFRLAKALAASGDMVPKPFQGKPEATMAAIVRGLEIGLAPMQALSNIAVINGRASLWGDALPALMQRAGHNIDVIMEGEGDTLKATATLTRGDNGMITVRTFTADDAKAANLWGKVGPWQQYKPRMMSLRARTLAIRDGAADALMGLQVAEEVQDYPPMRNVSPPEGGGFSAMITKAREEAASEAKDTAETENTNDKTATEGDDAPDADDPKIDDQSAAYANGVQAGEGGLGAGSCPYTDSPDEARDWLAGWETSGPEQSDEADQEGGEA